MSTHRHRARETNLTRTNYIARGDIEVVTNHSTEVTVQGRFDAWYRQENFDSATLGTRARLVERRNGVAKVPRRDSLPSPRRLDLHPTALRAHENGIRNTQSALVDHRLRAHRRVGAGLDRERRGVLSAVLGRLAPGPSVANRGRDREFALCDYRDTDYKRQGVRELCRMPR